jgi:hypothetical protein
LPQPPGGAIPGQAGQAGQAGIAGAAGTAGAPGIPAISTVSAISAVSVVQAIPGIPSIQGATGAASPASAAVAATAGKLADVLEMEALLYRDAAEISAKKTDVIVKGKIEELDSLVRVEQAIIIKIGKMEAEREAATQELSAQMGLELEGVTLSEINTRLDADSFSRLDNCQRNLVATLAGLKNTNDLNSELIQNALDYINFSVNLMTADQSGGNIYSQDGEDDAPTPRRNIFDVRM